MQSPPPVNKIQWYEKPLTMSLRDIVKEYREAKNQKKQIDILADLNHTKGCRIAWLLDRCGEDVDKVKLPRKSRDANAPDLDRIWRDTPLGAEAAQINMERKHRIMEEKTMCEEKSAECADNIEKAVWTAPNDALKESLAAFGNAAREMGNNLAKSFERIGEINVNAHEENETVSGEIKEVSLDKLITAEFWQIYLSHTFRPVNDADVAAMLTLANIAERLAE